MPVSSTTTVAPAAGFGERQAHFPALAVVDDGVIRQIEQDFIQDAFDAVDDARRTGEGQRHVRFLGLIGQLFDDAAADLGKLHRLKPARQLVFVQPRELDDVLDERQQPRGLQSDFSCKFGDVLGPRDSVADDFRIAHDRGQRRFQLVRHIGGKLLAKLLGAFAVGDVDDEQHRGVPAVLPALDRRGGQPVKGGRSAPISATAGRPSSAASTVRI